MRECSPPPNVSRVMCHMSHVMCHMSRVMCHFFFGQIGEAYRWRVCYQRGLPRLVHAQPPVDIFLFTKCFFLPTIILKKNFFFLFAQKKSNTFFYRTNNKVCRVYNGQWWCNPKLTRSFGQFILIAAVKCIDAQGNSRPVSKTQSVGFMSFL